MKKEKEKKEAKKNPREYWSRKPLFDTGADYLMVFGQNCSGKSYQAKEEAIQRAMKGEKFFYLRRMVDEVNEDKAALYFSDMPVNELTKGEWDGISARRGLLYFFRYDDKGKKEISSYIGAYDSLYNWQKIKSVAWVNFTYVIFEEFISATYFLDDECSVLQKCASAIFRDHKGTVFMLGNSISRNVPYFQNWVPNVYRQAPGTIEIYHYTDEAGEGVQIDIAIEYTAHIKGTGKMFFGRTSKTILAGEWDIEEEPKLPKEYTFYEKVYECAVKYQNFAFVLQLLVDPITGIRLLYVYPFTGSRKIERIISDQFSTDINVTRYFRPNPAENAMRECFIGKRAVYSDNLTANDFKGVFKQMGL